MGSITFTSTLSCLVKPLFPHRTPCTFCHMRQADRWEEPTDRPVSFSCSVGILKSDISTMTKTKQGRQAGRLPTCPLPCTFSSMLRTGCSGIHLLASLAKRQGLLAGRLVACRVTARFFYHHHLKHNMGRHASISFGISLDLKQQLLVVDRWEGTGCVA